MSRLIRSPNQTLVVITLLIVTAWSSLPVLVPAVFAFSPRALLRPTGAAANVLFGVSVSGAGDVNGDGYGDVVVGGNQNDAGGAEAGRA